MRARLTICSSLVGSHTPHVWSPAAVPLLTEVTVGGLSSSVKLQKRKRNAVCNENRWIRHSRTQAQRRLEGEKRRRKQPHERNETKFQRGILSSHEVYDEYQIQVLERSQSHQNRQPQLVQSHFHPASGSVVLPINPRDSWESLPHSMSISSRGTSLRLASQLGYLISFWLCPPHNFVSSIP